jgi:hypothetical protein
LARVKNINVLPQNIIYNPGKFYKHWHRPAAVGDAADSAGSDGYVYYDNNNM